MMMGREVRKIHADWVHPADGYGRTIPMHEGLGGRYAQAAADWWEGYNKWQGGLCRQYGEGEKWGPIDPEYKAMRYTDYSGSLPSPDDYMPDWPVEQLTHFMMYEDTSEGTPISPAFFSPEELAQWLADTGASAFAGQTANYDHWLAVCKGGYAPSMVIENGTQMSGVEFAGRQNEGKQQHD